MSRSAKFTGSTSNAVEIMKDVARTYGRGENSETLAKKWSVKPARISAYATGLRAMGVNVEKLRKTGLYLRVVDELRSESPDLFKADKPTVKRGRPAKTARG